MPHVSHEALRSLALPTEKTALQRLAAQRRRIDVPTRSARERFPEYETFPFGWMFAAFSSDVPAGTIRTIRRSDLDLLVWRGTDGAVTVSAAHCPHRGAHIGVGGEVHGCELVCPYHWWRFDAAGENTAIPYQADPSDARLPVYPTIERGGLVLFWYHPDPTVGPRWEIPELPEVTLDDWGPLVTHVVEFAAPWIEVAENFPDKVHVRTVHGVDNFTDIHRLEFTEWGHRQEASFDHASDDGTFTEHMVTEAFGPGFSVVRSVGPIEWTFVLAVAAVDFETTIAAMGYRLRRTDDARPGEYWTAVERAMIDFSRTQWAEDAAIFSHKVHAPIRGNDPEDDPARRYRAWAERFHRPD